MLAIWRNQSSRWRRGPRRSNCRAACAEAGRPTVRREHRSRPQPGQGVPQKRHGRVAGQEQKRRAERQDRVRTVAKPECRGRQRRHGGAAPQGRGTGTGERADAGGGGGRKKRPRRRSELRPVCWTLLIGWIGYNELDSPMRDE